MGGYGRGMGGGGGAGAFFTSGEIAFLNYQLLILNYFF